MNVFTEVVDDVTYVSYHKIDSKNHKTFQILVRPDVSEDSLLTLTQQILITSSGAVTRHVPVSGLENPQDSAHRLTQNLGNDYGRATPSPTSQHPKDALKTNSTDKIPEKLLSPYLEAINSTMAGTSLPWHTIRVYLGVNMDLQRCLVLVVQPTPAAAGTNTATLNLNGDVVTVMRSVIPGVFRGIGVNTYSHAAHLASSDQQPPTASAALTTAAPVYVSPVRKTFLDFCQQLASELNTAMREESLTLDYMHSVPASMTGPVQGIQGMYGSSGPGRSRALDSFIDLSFIRDLHCATAQLMTLRLLEQADKLDFRVKIIEQKCARLMTLLKPSYTRARLDLPVPPMSKSILSYELVLERACIAESANVECWKLILLRARRKCREILSQRSQRKLNGDNTSPSYDNYGYNNSISERSDSSQPDNRTESQVVLDCIVEQYVVWAQGEYKQRLFRKINSVKDRLETIHRFRIQLILNLHERFIVNGTTNAVTTTSWFSSNNDLTYQQSVREKFPFLSLTEPVLFDTQAILLSGKQGMFDAAAAALNGKTGLMYLTLGYVMFYCGGGWGTSVEIEVVSLRSVVLLEVVCSDGTLVSFAYSSDTSESTDAMGSVTDTGGVGSDGREGLTIQQGDKSINILSPTKFNPSSSTVPSASSNTTTSAIVKAIPASGKQPNTIRLVDSTGTTDVTLTVTGLTDDYVRRVADLLDLIIKDMMYQLREPHPTISTITASRAAVQNSKDSSTSNPASGTYHSISDIDDIMDLLALPSANNSSATNAINSDASPSVSANESRKEPTSSSTSTMVAAVAAPLAVGNTSSTSTVHRTPALLSARAEIPVLPTPPVQPKATMADLEFDDLLLPPLQLGYSADATQNDSISHPSTATVGNDNSKFGTLTLDAGSQQDLDDFFKELTIHTPVNASHSGAISPAAASGGTSISNNNRQADVFEVFGSDVLVPRSVTNTNAGPSISMPNTISANSNMSTSNQGLLGLQSSSVSSLNTLSNAPSVRSQSNNAISSINIGTSVTTVNKPVNNKPTHELFNDLLLTSMSTTTSNVKRVTPAATSPIINSTNMNTVVNTTVSVGAVGSDKIVRTPALLSSSSTVPNPSTTSATNAVLLATIMPTTQRNPVPPAPTASITSTDTKEGVSAQNSILAATANTNPGPSVATTSEAIPAPAKKSLGGNIQKFLAQSQAQKAKQAADAAKK
eukprot:gene11752-13644_t